MNACSEALHASFSSNYRRHDDGPPLAVVHRHRLRRSARVASGHRPGRYRRTERHRVQSPRSVTAYVCPISMTLLLCHPPVCVGQHQRTTTHLGRANSAVFTRLPSHVFTQTPMPRAFRDSTRANFLSIIIFIIYIQDHYVDVEIKLDVINMNFVSFHILFEFFY